jgi:hypothetical protein
LFRAPVSDLLHVRMDWRESILSFRGPGILSGISLGDWLDLLRRQQGEIDFSRLPRVATDHASEFEDQRLRSS